ncbi:hypothetical protein [Jeongeupia sp. USM3]|uniref:hypothetical protein n=1 Tax=Jeongeupia sp. USM3 TaxID=1906741 RepID=UPI00089DD749|nr:hypothetical protein [Jeongeupia sp. USM3]AOY01722.1 hypothetical protein BJP62_15385 [Jeongeupia sp. USM3]
MYILLIGYLYVVVMFAAASGSVAKAIVWIGLLGVLPTWLLIWLKRRGQIVRERKAEEAARETGDE